MKKSALVVVLPVLIKSFLSLREEYTAYSELAGNKLQSVASIILSMPDVGNNSHRFGTPSLFVPVNEKL